MNELPLSSRFRTNAGDPVDDKTRADVGDRLADEFTRGNITQDVYLSKLDVVYQAQTLGQLAEIEASLPAKSTHQVPAIVEQPSGVPGEVNRVGQGNLMPIVAVAGLVAIAAVILIILIALL